MIELRTLGALALRDAGGEDLHSVLAQPKRVALLAYLALARPHGFHRRDTLLALLWPEQDEQHARWALNQALRHLRTALGKEAVPSRGDGEVGIDPGMLSCDAVELETAIEADDLGRALELYRGDLLEGFHVSGCGEFERWLEEERGWLRRRAAQAATALARREEARGEAVSAGHWARRALALAPDDEGEVRSLIELLDRLGDRAGAVQAYEEFARRLRVEYEVEPAPETVATITAVRERRPAVPAKASPASDEPPSDLDGGAPAAASLASPGLATRLSRRPILLGAGLMALLAVGGIIQAVRPPSDVPHGTAASRTTIAILPFTYRGSPEFAYLSEGMVDLLSANLNGAGEIRTVDPYAVLALVRQAGRDRLEPHQAGVLAERVGAGSYVAGNVVETGGTVRISARLQSGRQEDDRAWAVVGGPSTQLFRLVDELTAQLIAQANGGPAAGLSRLAALTTDSLAALKAYLEAERHFRAWQRDSSLEAAQRALRIDSSFALAYYRLAMIHRWSDKRYAAEAVGRALRHGLRLNQRDRRLLEALASSYQTHVAEAARGYREILHGNPHDLEAAFQLAELSFVWSGVVGSWLDARELYERVLSLDPGHHQALFYLSGIAARERRLQQLDSLTGRILPIFPRETQLFFRGQRAVAFADSAEIERFLAMLRQSGEEIAQWSGGAAVFTTGDLVVGRRIWRVFTEPSRSRGLRVLAHLTLAEIELMSGRWRAAQAELDAAEALDAATALEHRALLSLWPLQQVSRSELLDLRSSLQRWRAAPGPSNDGFLTAAHAPAHPYLRLYLLGLLGSRLGDHDAALDQAAELERRAEASFAPTFVRGLGRSLRVEVARNRGRSDEALATLDSAGFWIMGELNIGNSAFYDREYEQFARAELLGALGRDAEALQAYRGIAGRLFHSGAPAHLRIAQLYERQGERQKAAAHYARFAELWKDCDPEFRPLVEEARRRMAG